MATDVDVQYFSHLNGLTLGNNWGDLIRLLDKALVTGIDFTQITAASIDAQGDVNITLYAAHNAMLLQVVELSGFAPTSLNQRYRIKGVPSATELILKPHTVITETSIATMGSGKLASLGYNIVFRDVGDVKRVYRAKNPTAQHPFIRVDESLTSQDGTTGVYTSNYAKYAMVGLLENMGHIDDCANPDVLQLPFDPVNPAKNWKISGTDSNVVRGWCRWHWARNTDGYNSGRDSMAPASGSREFTLCGDTNAFYMFNAFAVGANTPKQLLGCGLFESAIDDGGYSPPWFMMGPTDLRTAGTNIDHTAVEGGWPLMYSESSSRFLVTDTSLEKTSHNYAKPILPHRRLNGATNSSLPDEYRSGANDIVQSGFFVIQIPFMDQVQLRGTLKHIAFAGGTVGLSVSTPSVQGNSMYVYDGSVVSTRGTGGCYFYLGDLE